MRVLVVDDDLGTRETFQAALRHGGYDVELADSGTAAIAALSSISGIHGLLLDLNLGDMTGFDVLRWMGAQPLIVPTAVMTAFRPDFEPDLAIALGASVYADQPLSIEDVLALAENLTAPPSSYDDLLRLHRRYLAGHPGALDCIASALLRTLPPRLERAFAPVPWDFAVDATTDAFLEYVANPSRFDPSRNASIMNYVYLIARRNLANRLQAEFALKNREARYARAQPVILKAVDCTGCSEIDLWASMMEVAVNERERRAAQLWLNDAGNDAIADALGMGRLTLKERRREARRFKDRLLKRLSRHFKPRRCP